MNTQGRKTSIDSIVDERLPLHIKKTIREMELSLEELADWEDNKSPFKFLLNKDGLRIDIHLRIPTLKLIVLLAGLAGAGGGLWIVSKLFLVP